MPAMTEQQYWEAGRKAAAAGDPPAPLRLTTWQGVAYRRGFTGAELGLIDKGRQQHRPVRGRAVPPPRTSQINP